ncbi:MAG: 1-(5-phosphoribosyl)-5-[(5-phosphoribosylamino)methylideneamino]imidazole-4-carboxamide isomerase [Angelakisella sp.]
MIILPAIDIKDGQCVRLRQGDFSTVHRVAESPSEAAAAFAAAGARWLHVVDLDGAKTGNSQNAPVLQRLADSCGMSLELGGGIRSLKTIESYLTNGISRVILGSAAVKNPALVREAIELFGGERIAVGIDARNGMVATEGWLEASSVNYLELAKAMEQAGVRYIIYTDILRDGMLQGVSKKQLAALSAAVSCNIIASGGVRDLDDVRRCAELGLYGMICGKSVYSGSLSLPEALKIAGEQGGTH